MYAGEGPWRAGAGPRHTHPPRETLEQDPGELRAPRCGWGQGCSRCGRLRAGGGWSRKRAGNIVGTQPGAWLEP